MSIARLRTLIAVADAGSFAAAAQRVHLSHAAVSQQMRALEEEWGVALFDRSARSVALTRQGRAIAARAREVVRAYDTLVPTALGDPQAGELRLGAVPTTLTGLMARTMARLAAERPGLRIRLQPGLTTRLLPELARGALDAALVTEPSRLPPGLEAARVASEPLCLVAPAGAGGDATALLRARPFIRFSRSATVGQMIDDWLDTHGLAPAELMELESLEAAASMVAATGAVSILPLPVGGALPEGLVALPLAGAPARRLVLACRRGGLAQEGGLAAVLAAMRRAAEG